MIGISTKPTITTKTETRVETRIANIITATIKTQSLTKIYEEISVLRDEGLIAETNDFVRCNNCGSLLKADSAYCSNCGYDFFDKDSDTENIINDEIEYEEDTPVQSADENNLFDEALRDYDISDMFSDKLVEFGWTTSDAELGGLVCAGIWEQHKPINVDALTSLLDKNDRIHSKILNSDALKKIIIDGFKIIMEEENKLDKNTPENWDIQISNIDGKWVASVNNPLEGFEFSNPSKLINIGSDKTSFFIKCSRYINILKEREENLRRLGFVLINERKEFFEAKIFDDAENNLKNKPLHQNKVALKLGVSESTLSRWCENVNVSTPHGIFLLKDFFSMATGKRKEAKRTKEELKEIINSIEKKGIPEILELLKKDYGIEMSERNLRYYLKRGI